MRKNKGYCIVSAAPVRAETADQSEIVTQLLFGDLVEVYEINQPWAKITLLSDGYSGYIDHKHIVLLSDKEVKRWSDGLSYLTDRQRLLETPWGKQWIYRGSSVPEGLQSFSIGSHDFSFKTDESSSFDTPLEYAEDYLNTPYLWGGRSPFGIDCSGITQVIYRFFGFNLPRDASQQVDLGAEIEFEDHLAGDLAYFTNSKGKVTHVGILDGNGGIIHASGHVRKDSFTVEGIVHSDSGILTHDLYVIKRM